MAAYTPGTCHAAGALVGRMRFLYKGLKGVLTRLLYKRIPV